MNLLYPLALLLLCTAVFAHSGGTDANGGHHNRKRGGYHYHHGRPAHDHVNGVCMYEKEGENRSSYWWYAIGGAALGVAGYKLLQKGKRKID